MNYHNIEKHSTLNGAGCRTVLWVSGCEHYCKKCQNPQTWSYGGGVEYDDVAHQELLLSLQDKYCDGLTLSGGDVMSPKNLEPVYNIMLDIKANMPNLNVWIYTGYKYEDIINCDAKLKLLELCDVLVDGKFEIDKFDKSLKWCGSSNQRIIDIKQSLLNDEIVLYDL